MSLIVGTVLAFVFLDWPWRGLALLGLAAFEAFEILLFLRWRGVRARTGAESLVGRRGTAITDCRPDGQVRLQGQIWNASCPEGVEAGSAVVVTAVNGIRLRVARA